MEGHVLAPQPQLHKTDAQQYTACYGYTAVPNALHAFQVSRSKHMTIADVNSNPRHLQDVFLSLFTSEADVCHPA